MRSFLFLLSGVFIGLYLSWPGIMVSKNWKCFNDIVRNISEDKISIKAVMEISPSYFLRSRDKNIPSRMRIIADACFR